MKNQTWTTDFNLDFTHIPTVASVKYPHPPIATVHSYASERYNFPGGAFFLTGSFVCGGTNFLRPWYRRRKRGRIDIWEGECVEGDSANGGGRGGGGK